MSSASVDRRLEGKVAIVTGAGRGIGRAEALLFAQHGAHVVVNDLPAAGDATDVAAAVVAAIRAAGGSAVVDHHNIASWEGGAAVVQQALDSFGHIDYLSNNAGIIRPGRVDRLSEQDFDQLVAVNLKGYFATVRHAAPHFVRQCSGVIINKGSPAGFGQYGMSAYAASKEGVVGFTRSIARDLGEFGVRANVVIPISFQTTMGTPEVQQMASYARARHHNIALWNRPMLPAGPVHPGPEHVAALSVWLCTAAAGEINGRELFIAGTELGLLPEPELQRSSFEAAGWTLQDLDKSLHQAYLFGQIRNRFK